jgi:murein DD-endopeptidase MepM/ murein hydrolase activator NlpD
VLIRLLLLLLLITSACLLYLYGYNTAREQFDQTIQNYQDLYQKVTANSKKIDKFEYVSQDLERYSGNESIFASVKSRYNSLASRQLLQNPYQRELAMRGHGIGSSYPKNYQLRYPWMTFPLREGIVKYKQSEFGGKRQHTGLDFAATTSLEVLSSSDGTVTETGYDIRGGNYILIKTVHDSITYILYYGHLEVIEVRVGQEVKQGERIGIVGETGRYCFGRHLHWGIRLNGWNMNPVISTTWGNRIEVSLR